MRKASKSKKCGLTTATRKTRKKAGAGKRRDAFVDIEKQRRTIKQYSGKAKPPDFKLS